MSQEPPIKWKIWVNESFYRAGTGMDAYVEHIASIRADYDCYCTIKTEIT